MKVAKACVRCRASKRKCRIEGSNGCEFCLKFGFPCSRAAITPSLARSLAPFVAAGQAENLQASVSPDEPSLHLQKPTARDFRRPSPELLRMLIELYLKYIHNRSHSLFHEASLWKSFGDGNVPTALLYGICGLGARFSQDESIRALARDFQAEAKLSLRQDMEEVSVANIQACILIANLCAAELQTQAEALYFGLANRKAHILGLHKTDFGDSIVTREEKVRIWWTLVMADKWCSSGLGLPQQLVYPGKRVRMPYDEYEFRHWEIGKETLTEWPLPGLWAHMITLVEIFEPIQDLNRQLVEENLIMDNLDTETHRLASLLDTWLQDLPLQVQWSVENLDNYCQKGLGGTFIALHLSYHHYSTLLFFQYLDLKRLAEAECLELAAQCRYHATSYSEILQVSREKPDSHAVYAAVGHMTVISSSVLLHTLLFGEDGMVPDAWQRLNANFAALVELKEFWPSLSSTIARLFAFQNACLCSADPNTHKIDRWLIRFLLEHAIPLDDRFGGSQTEFRSYSDYEGFSNELSQRQSLAEQALIGLLG